MDRIITSTRDTTPTATTRDSLLRESIYRAALAQLRRDRAADDARPGIWQAGPIARLRAIPLDTMQPLQPR